MYVEVHKSLWKINLYIRTSSGSGDEAGVEAAEGERGGHQEEGDEAGCPAQGRPATQQVGAGHSNLLFTVAA